MRTSNSTVLILQPLYSTITVIKVITNFEITVIFLFALHLIKVSFSGCLIENLNNLANNNHIYSPGWNQKYSDGINSLKTRGGYSKLDFVSFTYHHSLTTLIDKYDLQIVLIVHLILAIFVY